MAQNRTQAKIIPFPTRAGEERKEPLVLERRETPCLPWPPGPLDRFELPEQERVRWLDEALVAARVRELSFLRALAQIAPTALRPEMVSGPLMRFHEAARHLTLSIELLRLGQIGPDEVEVLLPGLRRSWGQLRLLRTALLEDLGPEERAHVQAEEARNVVGPLDVERSLQERSLRRSLPQDSTLRHMVMPGGMVLELPGEDTMELHRRREQRLQQDNRPVNVEMDLAGWIEELPREWLEGIARTLRLPLTEDRWEQERRVREELLNPSVQMRVIEQLFPMERRILARVSAAGGVHRYDLLVHDCGGDDETAWHWADEVPLTPLERVRRCGLLYVGQTQLGRRSHRVAVIPAELRESVAALLSRV